MTRAVRWIVAGAALASAATAGWAAPQPPQVAIAAAVDQARVNIGQPLTLTITVSGDLAGLKGGPEGELPQGFKLAASRRSTNVAIQGRVIQRSVSFISVLVPTAAGTFQLGPFRVVCQGRTISTDPIAIEVKKPILPPGSEAAPRLTL
ncbi:MAG: BatD family protein [Candidatus Omnitrophica bacterium]|nr:BatD family protein [Candidatus Omnitrophota bacterium]